MIFEVKTVDVKIDVQRFDVVDQEGRLHGSFPKASSAIARVETLTAQYNRLMEIL